MSTVKVEIHGEIHSVEAAMPGKSAGPCPVFACYTLAFAIQLSTETQKTSVSVVEKYQHILAISQVRFADPILPTLGDLGRLSFSEDICRAAN